MLMKAVRVLVLLAGALTMTLLPCVPALAAFESCRMPGCETSQEQTLTAPDCCCGVANAPALSAAPATLSPQGKTASLPPSIPLAQGEAGASSFAAARDVTVQPPIHVPLFLLHSSLLI